MGRDYAEGCDEVIIGDKSQAIVESLLSEELLYHTEDISRELYGDFTSPFDIFAIKSGRSILIDVKLRSYVSSSIWLWKLSIDNKLEYSTRTADFRIIIFHIGGSFKAIIVKQALALGMLTKDGSGVIIEHYMLTNLGNSLRHLDKYLDKIQLLENPDG